MVSRRALTATRKTSRTFGITTLTKRHVSVRGNRIAFRFRAKHKALVRTALVDAELAGAMRELLAVPGGARVFRYETDGELRNLTGDAAQRVHPRATWARNSRRRTSAPGAARSSPRSRLAEHGPPETEAEAKRTIAAMRVTSAESLGNTPAVARASYVSPAVIEQYLDGRTIEDFRPRQLRVVGARDIDLDAEELALLSLLRSWRIRRARLAA